MNGEKRSYLNGLVYDLLPKERILAGFIKYYVLNGQSLVHLQSDIALISWPVAAGEAAKRVVRELEIFAEERLPHDCPVPKGSMTFAEMLGKQPIMTEPAPEDKQ